MLYNYVDTNLDDNLICCICRAPFNEPVTTRTCFHTFCQECILQALGVSNHCPIDRSPLSVEHLGQADPIVRHLVEELTVRCPYLDAGCKYTGERHLLESHLKLQCPCVQIPCPCSDEDCKRIVARRDAAGGGTVLHQESDLELDNTHPSSCESCGKDFPNHSVLKDHLASSCPEKVVPCSQADNGCVWRGQRVSLETHVDQCPYESIKGFFAIHNTQMAQLSKDNGRLRRRTDELEGTIRILRQELEWTKIALGPWYRPAYPERQIVSASYAQRPDGEGPALLRGVDPTGDTSRSEPRAEDGAIETFDFFDPFSFIGQRQNHLPGIHATNNTSTATSVIDVDPGTDTPVDGSDQAVGPHSIHDLNGDAAYEIGPLGSGSLNGSGSVHNATAAVSPGASNPQSTSAAPPVTLFSDHFPSGNQMFEGGSSSRQQGWQHVSSPPNSTSPNPSPSIHSPVSTPDIVTQIRLRVYNSPITYTKTGVAYEQNHPPVPGPNHPYLAPSHPVPCNRPQFTPSTNKHVVAPLNLSTTVEGSLVGLRESLITLSAALESQGRRLELALTTEGLRVSEEVGSLKAIVQGLRMQVHAIMMDRNALVSGRIGGVVNVPSNIGGRPQQSQQSPGSGGMANGEDSNDDHGLRMSEESEPSLPGGSRFMEGYYGSGGMWGFPSQQPLPPGFAMPMMGPNFPIGPPLHPGVRFNHPSQSGVVGGGGVLPLGGLPTGPLPPHHLYMSSTAGSGPKL